MKENIENQNPSTLNTPKKRGRKPKAALDTGDANNAVETPLKESAVKQTKVETPATATKRAVRGKLEKKFDTPAKADPVIVDIASVETTQAETPATAIKRVVRGKLDKKFDTPAKADSVSADTASAETAGEKMLTRAQRAKLNQKTNL